jgi:hypothetical protein
LWLSLNSGGKFSVILEYFIIDVEEVSGLHGRCGYHFNLDVFIIADV